MTVPMLAYVPDYDYDVVCIRGHSTHAHRRTGAPLTHYARVPMHMAAPPAFRRQGLLFRKKTKNRTPRPLGTRTCC
jgi:hypothetical protein